MFSNFEPRYFLVSIIVLVISIALHEFGHAYSADRLGDTLPRRQGRVTLWPDKHFDPIGFMMIVISSVSHFGIGWGKPVQIDPRQYRNPGRDMVIVTLCGPLMNLLLALIFGLTLRAIVFSSHVEWLVTVDGTSTTLGLFLETFTSINLGLMFFNMIPVPPLDGSKVLPYLLHVNAARAFEHFMAQYGQIMLLIVFISPAARMVLQPAVAAGMSLITGLHYGY